jgi:2-amino-4-hydroxy-6-hydroxymethyldihydropteridine diphosphokinase
METHVAYLSVGSNIGNKRSNCERGIADLTDPGTATLIVRSPFYRTEPVDYRTQGWFVNAVVKIKTADSPLELLGRLKQIEKKNGRTDNVIRFGPRFLDLDIIMFDDLVIKSSRLTLPHPRMHHRRFVLQPMCDIDPSLVHPGLKKSMKQLLDEVPEDGQRIILYR